MVKYIIEGGSSGSGSGSGSGSSINFNDELYKSLDADDVDNGVNVCLITGMPLIENSITLECGHKFNYVPLYHDILNHKKKFNVMENKMLKNIEIRCPYCRNVQKNLLPYHKYPGVKQVHGVNYFDELLFSKYDSNMCFVTGICEYNESCINSSVLLLKENNKHYCLYHKYKVINDLSIQHKLKLKQDKADLKLKIAADKLAKDLIKMQSKNQAKEQQKIAKEQVKEQQKIDKEQVKEQVKEQQQKIELCSIILKSGKNKNCQCSNKIHKDTLCYRHYKLVQPSSATL